MSAVNPVFRRELIAVLESRKAYVFTALYLAGGGLMVYLGWPDAGRVMQGTQIARRLFQSLCLLQLASLGVFLPALVAPVFAREREGNCYDLLVTTPLSNAALLAGKLAPAIVFIALLILGALPFTSACTLLGGLSFAEVTSGTLVVMSAGMVFASLSCLFSAWLDRTQAALAASYLTVLPLAAWSTMAIGYGGVSPFVLPLVLTVALTAAMALVAVAAALFAQAARDGNGVAAVKSFTRTERVLLGILGAGRRRGALTPRRALALKELKCDFFTGRSRWIRLVFWVGAGMALLISTLPFEGRTGAYALYVMTLILLLGGATAATVFSREREAKTLEGLALLPLPPTVLLRAKFAAPFRITLLLAALLWLPALAAAAAGRLGLMELAILTAILVSLADISVTAGTLCSLMSSTSSLAVTRTYAGLALLAGLPIVLRALADAAILTDPELNNLFHWISPYLFVLDWPLTETMDWREGAGLAALYFAIAAAGKVAMRAGFARWVRD